MKQDMKICIPRYKIACSVCYLIILSLIRGISIVDEIGIALDENIGLLAMAFCGDTLCLELSGKRSEVFALFPMKKKLKAAFRRLFLQLSYLCVISYIGYFFFYWQHPWILNASAGSLYGMYILAVTATILFWGTVSMILSGLCRNQWVGIGISLVLWLVINSKTGNVLLGNFSIFAFSFRNIQGAQEWGWLLGKGAGVLLAAGMTAMLPWIIKKRG